MYVRLKERALRRFVAENKTRYRDRLVLVSGCRAKESRRRMGNTRRISRDRVKVWCNPLIEWDKEQVLNLLQCEGCQRSEVARKLCMSGECLCGAFAQEGELDSIGLFYPEFRDYIRDLERRVREAGFPWGWEESPPKRRNREREPMLSTEMPLCHSCEAKRENPE